MLLYEYFIEPENIKKLSLKAIRYLAQELSIFLSFYEKYILLVTPEDKEMFRQLKQISDLLNSGQYDKLINNPDLMIDVDDFEEEVSYLPDYYPY